jgi:uncharacterized protein (DUF1697 family)
MRRVALLRGINVGKAKRIAMADLRAVFEKLGCSAVATLLNSGNVVFEPPKGAAAGLEERVRAAIEKKTGVSSRAVILRGEELAAIVEDEPLGEKARAEPSRYLVCVIANPRERSKALPLLAQDFGRERVALGTRAIYVHLPQGIIDSAAMKAIEKAFPGGGITSRNWSTIQKLRALV